ncbi:UNVERIFIED_CONTAM: hypothetical protein K2H54_014033 [Gekko kuhli]
MQEHDRWRGVCLAVQPEKQGAGRYRLCDLARRQCRVAGTPSPKEAPEDEKAIETDAVESAAGIATDESIDPSPKSLLELTKASPPEEGRPHKGSGAVSRPMKAGEAGSRAENDPLDRVVSVTWNDHVYGTEIGVEASFGAGENGIDQTGPIAG